MASSYDAKRSYYHLKMPLRNIKKNGIPILKSISFRPSDFPVGWGIDNIVGDFDKCQYICGVCQGLARIPMEISKCGHCFCEYCILEFIKHNKCNMEFRGLLCPYCKQLFMISSCSHFEKISNILFKSYNKNLVRCIYECGKSYDPERMNQHECWICPNRPVVCPNLNCKIILPDSEMEKHLNVCEHRLNYCKLCRLPKLWNDWNHNCNKEFTITIESNIFNIFNYL